MVRMSLILAFATMLFSINLATATTIGQQPDGNPEARKVKNPVAATPKSIAAGAKLFRTYCRMCHGSDAKGNGPQAPKGSHPANLTDEKWEHASTDDEISQIIRNGVGPKFDMKGFQSRLSAEEIWSLVHYLRSIGPHGSH